MPHGHAESEPESLLCWAWETTAAITMTCWSNPDLKDRPLPKRSPVWRSGGGSTRLFVRLRGRVSVFTVNRAILCKIGYNDFEYMMDTQTC